jgi:hypothetical protein
MGCNCKHGRATKLNNLDSIDHLKLASETYTNIISQKSVEEMDEFDTHEIISVYTQLFPNQKIKPTIEQAIGQLTIAHERYTSTRR